MTDWVSDAERLRDTGAVLVTVAGVRGSAPRDVGARMLVTARDARGTIGGGELEYRCTRIAAALIGDETQKGGFLRRFPLGSNCGQCCGGVVDVLFERLADADSWLGPLTALWRERRPVAMLTTLDDDGRPLKTLVTADDVFPVGADPDALAAARSILERRAPAARLDNPGRRQAFLLVEPVTGSNFDIAVFGAGHVGSALVQVLSALDCELRWIDSRRNVFPRALPATVQAIASPDPAREVAALPPGTFCFVMTHSHATDYAICANVLARDDSAYCGLIGSLTKRRRFEKRLRQQGFAEARIARLVCPIGIGGIRGKQPAEIAIAAAAELLRRRERLVSVPDDSRATVLTLRQSS